MYLHTYIIYTYMYLCCTYARTYIHTPTRTHKHSPTAILVGALPAPSLPFLSSHNGRLIKLTLRLEVQCKHLHNNKARRGFEGFLKGKKNNIIHYSLRLFH